MENKSRPNIFDCAVRLRENPIRHRENVRIGCGAGFRGDRPAAALKLLQRVPNLNYLVLECLAERTLAIRYDTMMSGGHGYDSRISEWMSVLLPLAVERGVRIITNMGAMDALGAQEEVLRIAKSHSLTITVAAVYEVFETQAGWAAATTSTNFASGGVSTYLGADPIVRVLELSQPHVIITTRLADASLFLGPMVYELGWNWNDFLELSQGTLAGHLLECGCQVTGGYYMHPADHHRKFSFQQLLDTSLPFADITFDGNVCVAKAEKSGGELNFSTCAQQLLYEVGDPSAYVTPDAECGWKAWGEISYGGLGCVKRALAADYLVPREHVFWGFDIKQSKPGNSYPLKHKTGDLEQLRCSARSTDYLAPPRGLPTQPAPGGKRIPLYHIAHSRAGDKGNDLNFSIIPHFPADIERLKVVITSDWVNDVFKVLMPPNAVSMGQHAEALEFEESKAFEDKGKMEFEESKAFEDKGKRLPKDEEHLVVEIYEAKGINSLNVVVRNALDGGVNCSRRIDRHGKTISDLILCQEIILPS